MQGKRFSLPRRSGVAATVLFGGVHTRAAIGQAAARAVAQRVQVAEHTLRRHRAPPSMQETSPSRPLTLRVSKILRSPSLVLVVLVGV